jgi:copper chaperone
MQTEFIKVTGMTCGGCTSKVTRALNGVPGVSDVKVALATGEAIVQYDELLTSPRQLQAAVVDAGYGVNSSDAAQAQQSKGCCCASKNANASGGLNTASKADQALRMPERSASAKLV